ncbi:MAG: thioredoxin family protein [Planctomycetota bacterium]|jgi:hypothetical protein
MRCAPFSVAAASLLSALLAPARVAAAEEDALSLPTALVHRSAWRADPLEPADRLAEARPLPLPLAAARPPGLRRAPAGADVVYGTLPAGDRPVFVAVVFGTGSEADVAVDLDGDGDLTGPGEAHRVTGRTGRTRAGEATRWQVRDLALGESRIDLAVQRLAAVREAVLIANAPVALAVASHPAEGLQPPALAGQVSYVVVPGADGETHAAFVRGEGDALALLVDRNRNGSFDDAGEAVSVPVVQREGGATFWKVDGVQVGAESVSLALKETPGPVEARITLGSARRGTVELGGRLHALHLLDADLDGRYDSASDFWWFGPVELLPLIRKLSPDSMVEASEPIHLEKPWRLASVDREGHAILILDPGAGTRDAYFQRRAERVNATRWFPAFDQEREEFVAEWGIDTRRPRADRPAHWLHDAGLEEAITVATREGKPILADFEADWCVWCKRFDYYVYPDAEVAALLSRFVLVKINYEFNYAGDLDRLGGRGLPFLVFLDPSGQPLTFTVHDENGNPEQVSGPKGFQTPAQFAETLRAAYRAWIESQGR